jgi:hypothetical protein
MTGWATISSGWASLTVLDDNRESFLWKGSIELEEEEDSECDEREDLECTDALLDA